MNPPPKAPIIGEARDQEVLETGTRYVYRKLPDGELHAHFIFPPEFDYEMDRCPAIIFFHGGKWDISAPNQFIPHGHHFANRGMVAIAAEYRTKNKFDGGPLEAMEDAKELILFIKKHAHQLGIDAGRIVVAGAGSGGHAALCASLHKTLDDVLSPRPDALVLFGPISDTSPRGNGMASELFPSPKLAKATSPLRSLPQKSLPPCLLFHGTSDRVVPFSQSVKFAKIYQKKRNFCELMEFTNAGHTFFNFNTGDQNYELTLRATDHFLVEKGFLQPDPHAGLVV